MIAREGAPGAVRALLRGRPWWMNGCMLFCAFMALAYVPWDIFWKPVERDEEVWLGIVLHGWAAKLTAPLHWAIYAAGGWAFWRMRTWMWPWASVYAAQIAVGMCVWALIDERGMGWWAGLVAGLPFAVLAWALWRARPLFGESSA